MMEILVVTGGIGSGKSAVCRIIESVFGCAVYNADGRVRDLYRTHPVLLSDIEGALGEDLRDDEGTFSPKKLASRIFSDEQALRTVESLVFPVLIDDFGKWAESYSTDRFVVFESATILEKPEFRSFGDRILLVDAPFDVRLKRAAARDSVSEEDIRKRMMRQPMMNQVSFGDISPDVDAVVRNVGTPDELEKKTIDAVMAMFDNILKIYDYED